MKFKTLLTATAAACLLSTAAFAGPTSPPTLPASCGALPNQSTLATNLKNVVSPTANYGLGFNMWATIVGNDGAVCAVAFSGISYTDQWLASRVISAQRAATANSLSLATVSSTATPNGNFAFASGNLYSADRDGGSLFGLQFSNPVSPFNAYQGGVALTAPDPTTFGQSNDPCLSG